MRKYIPHILIISFVFLLIQTAHAASYAGKFETWLIRSCKEGVRKNPDDAEAHQSLGYAYANSGKWKEAIESYKQALRIDTDYAEAHFGLGNAYRDSGKHKEAIESFKQVIRIDPDDALAHYKLGLTYLILKDRGSALEQHKILKTLDTELPNKLFDEINSE